MRFFTYTYTHAQHSRLKRYDSLLQQKKKKRERERGNVAHEKWVTREAKKTNEEFACIFNCRFRRIIYNTFNNKKKK